MGVSPNVTGFLFSYRFLSCYRIARQHSTILFFIFNIKFQEIDLERRVAQARRAPQPQITGYHITKPQIIGYHIFNSKISLYLFISNFYFYFLFLFLISIFYFKFQEIDLERKGIRPEGAIALDDSLSNHYRFPVSLPISEFL